MTVHPARFLLIGTMNPEEGDLRPQLLDRFGLMVDVVGPRDSALRAEVVRRRLAYETDPVAFAARWEADQKALRRQVMEGRELLPSVVLDEAMLALICRLCCEFEVDGLRADIVFHKAARALAALDGRMEVVPVDVKTAAEFVLPHRQRRRPFEQPHLDQERLEECLSTLQSPSDPETRAGDADSRESSGQSDDDSQRPEKAGESPETRQVFPPAALPPVRRIEVALPNKATGRTPSGRRNPTPIRERGHYVRAVLDENPVNLAADATIRAAVLRGGQAEGRIHLERGDLHRKERVGRDGTLLLFAVDASGSMSARRRMELVKGAVLGLLRSAYEQRDEVGVIAFRGTRRRCCCRRPAAWTWPSKPCARLAPPAGGRRQAHAPDYPPHELLLAARAATIRAGRLCWWS